MNCRNSNGFLISSFLEFTQIQLYPFLFSSAV